MNHTRKNKKVDVQYTQQDYDSDNGMLTSIWGPAFWHFLHTMSFNYPVNPTYLQKKHYRNFMLSLKNILPCGKCRKNLKKNFARHPLLWKHMNSRESFSRYLFELHELINKMLNKSSGLTYEQVRDRYENFRARCLTDPKTGEPMDPTLKEKGCSVPIYGVKSKCILKIIPQTIQCPSLTVDSKCLSKRATEMCHTQTKTRKNKNLHHHHHHYHQS